MKKLKQNKKSKNNKQSHKKHSQDLGKVFDKHIKCEFEEKDVDPTMKTMIKDPYVHHVPILTGGIGYDAVYNFYKMSFVGKMPTDTNFISISRTVGKDQVVDELILRFKHDIEIPAMLPGIPPTGKYVELPLVVVMNFKANKIGHEHIYWDQASLLAQIGLLDNKNLPIIGVDQSKKLQESVLSTQTKKQKKM